MMNPKWIIIVYITCQICQVLSKPELQSYESYESYAKWRRCDCGKTETKRIIGGKPASSKWKWIAAICYDQCTFDSQFCAGALINNDYVLTAAHCVYGEDAVNLTVTVADYDISSLNEVHEVSRKVAEIKIHEDYKISSELHDIALLRLETPIRTKRSVIKPICLPTDPFEPYTNVKAIAIGWGNTVYPSSQYPTVLQEATVKVYSHDDCITSSNYTTDEIKPTMMCAGKLGIDSCQGDSGGPLMYERNRNQFIIIGIVSWGQGCALKDYPGVYTRVTAYLDWISKNIKGSRCSQKHSEEDLIY